MTRRPAHGSPIVAYVMIAWVAALLILAFVFGSAQG